MKINEIRVNPPYIKLEQFLKFTGVCDTGGIAKIIIQDSKVKVNDEICEVRGKKLYNNDIVSINGENDQYKVIIDDN